MDLNKKPQDLEERTLEYGKRVVRLVDFLPKNQVNSVLSLQFLRSGTSVGANYREARESESGRDCKHIISICKKEAKESLFWIDLIIENNSLLEKRIIPLRNETQELVKIFSSICNKLSSKRK
jgi:four helix bundle protein